MIGNVSPPPTLADSSSSPTLVLYSPFFSVLPGLYFLSYFSYHFITLSSPILPLGLSGLTVYQMFCKTNKTLLLRGSSWLPWPDNYAIIYILFCFMNIIFFCSMLQLHLYHEMLTSRGSQSLFCENVLVAWSDDFLVTKCWNRRGR